MAALVPRCQVLQKSQVTGLDLPVLVSTIRPPRSKGSTVSMASSSISRTPPLPLLVKMARSSRSDQCEISAGTKRISRISRGFTRRSLSRVINVSRSISFTLTLYHTEMMLFQRYDNICRGTVKYGLPMEKGMLRRLPLHVPQWMIICSS